MLSCESNNRKTKALCKKRKQIKYSKYNTIELQVKINWEGHLQYKICNKKNSEKTNVNSDKQ